MLPFFAKLFDYLDEHGLAKNDRENNARTVQE